jgi:hypothetical protein
MSRPKPISARMKDVARPPEGEPWVWQSQSLLCSLAWRGQSINCRRLIDFLMREHMAHAGQENGQLVAPYRQLEAWGIGHRLIAPAILEAEQRGLIVVEHGALRGRAMRAENRYRLTFYATRRPGSSNGLFECLPPTNDWRQFRPSPADQSSEVSGVRQQETPTQDITSGARK